MENLKSRGAAALILRVLLSAPGLVKFSLVVSLDALTLFASAWLALYVRLGNAGAPLQKYGLVCLIVPLVGVMVLAAFGAYRSVIRYFCADDAWVIAKAVSFSVLAWVTICLVLQLSLPRSLILIQWLLAMPLMLGLRFAMRLLLRELSPFGYSAKRKNARNVIIYGAGSVGVQLVHSLASDAKMRAIAFVDDDATLHGRSLNGFRVYSFDSLEGLIKEREVDDVLLAMSAISPQHKKFLLEKLSLLPVRVRVLPSFAELTDGRVSPDDIRDIDITDLLGRTVVPPNAALLGANIENKVVMVTGAGGSIGSELCRQIFRQGPAVVVLFELSEYNLYAIERELIASKIEKYDSVRIIPILGNVQSRDHLEQVMRSYSVDTVYHAAAYKHVPMVEHNVVSSLRNNIFGTLNAAQASLDSGVKHFVLVSTDKAVRPTNVMGASKRFAEMILQGLADREFSSSTHFTIVRFGNVLGSSGSVVPLFKEQIEKGGPVTITDPDITRYFMTIPEAASLVLQAGFMGQSGDVFVLDMGSPIRILDLALQMIKLAGSSPYNADDGSGDIKVVFTGLRPGEKLFEELLVGDGVVSTDHPMIMSARERHLSWAEVEDALWQMEVLLRSGDVAKLRELLMRFVTDYQPQGDIVDLLLEDIAEPIASASMPSSKLNYYGVAI
ncbi:polysaccharide biosynthesis protein [Zhongshania arctica]|uniref:Polysaccharide biosynthesis protein n=1 Tax=Zhongshania arctica TaxID=3238302 RepID=A0ABV3TQN2_9GAMM